MSRGNPLGLLTGDAAPNSARAPTSRQRSPSSGRRDTSRDQEQINLGDADLSRAQLPEANLARCSLNYSNLTGANRARMTSLSPRA